MRNYYSTINGVILSFSDIMKNENGFETILARFERPNDSGFDFTEWKLPCICNIKSFGFSEDEIMEQERYLRNNAPLIWDIAREVVDEDTVAIGTVFGAITNPFSVEAEEHAGLYYESLRKRMPTEVSVIAKRTGFSKSQVLLVRNYLFVDEHDLEDGYRKFDSSFEIAQSWQRMSDENMEIAPHDITLILHELYEIDLVQRGLSQEEAHEIASRKYDYASESFHYYMGMSDVKDWIKNNMNSGAIKRLSNTSH